MNMYSKLIPKFKNIKSEVIENNWYYVFLNGPIRHAPHWANIFVYMVWVIVLYFQQWTISVQFLYRYFTVVRSVWRIYSFGESFLSLFFDEY